MRLRESERKKQTEGERERERRERGAAGRRGAASCDTGDVLVGALSPGAAATLGSLLFSLCAKRGRVLS